MLFYGIEVADGAEIKNLVVERGVTNPIGLTTTDRGRLFFNTTVLGLYMWTGTIWSQLGVAGSGVTSFNGRADAVTLIASDLTGLINSTNLPTASGSVLGGIKVGSGLTITSGVLSVAGSSADIPAGSKMLFAQPSAPTGWTQVTSLETQSRMLRVVDVAGGSVGSGGTGGFGYGGTDDPLVMNKVPSHTHAISGSTSTAGIHSHTSNIKWNTPAGSGYPGFDGSGDHYVTSAVSTTADGNHSHTVSGTAVANGGASDWTPKYLNLILCSKN